MAENELITSGMANSIQPLDGGDHHKTRPGGYVVSRVKTPMGKEVDSDSEEHRAWCEARHVLKMTHRADRQRYMADVLRRRGERSHQDLAEKVLEIWRLQKS